MRDLLVTMIVMGSLPFILYRPYIGVLMWAWLGYMNPHRLAFGFSVNFPFAQIVAIVTLVALVMSKENKRIPWTRETIVLSLFLLWMLVTTLNAEYSSAAWAQYNKVIKIQVMTFITLMIMGSRERLNLLIWVIVFSLGFYGVKGGIFTIISGGSFRVMGPQGTFIGGNNEIALALIMTIPLMRYLQLTVTNFWIRHGFSLMMFLTAVAIIGTHSRGALVGGAAMMLFLLLKSRKKFIFAIMLAVSIPVSLSFMPDHWFARMQTIETYQEDASALGRINAWKFAFNMALDRPTGGGFESFRRPLFHQYAPEPNRVHDAHSIYFEVLGEHGFIGLGFFLTLGLFTWFSASWVARRTKKLPDLIWAGDMARMIQVSLVGYAAGGAFLGLAYFDLVYHLMAIIVLLKLLVKKAIKEQEEAELAAAARPG